MMLMRAARWALLLGVLALAGCASAPPPESPPQKRPGLPIANSSGCYTYAIRRVPVPATGPEASAVLAAQVVATNHTSSPCSGPSCGGITGGWKVLNDGDVPVATFGPVGVACVAHPKPSPPVAPGASVVWTSFAWDGRGDPTGKCVPGDCHMTRPTEPPGLYRIRWTWLGKVAIETPLFQIPGA